jgi:hypothetical protein
MAKKKKKQNEEEEVEKIGEQKEKKAYDNDYPSVTQVLGVLRKPGLEMWYKHKTAAECDAISEKSRIIGSQFHELLKCVVEGKKAELTTEYEAELNNLINSFLKFRKERLEFELKWAEMQLTHKLFKYNGTMDCVANIVEPSGKRKLVIFDWKTGECKDRTRPSIYLEHLAQVSAYAYAYKEAHPEIFGLYDGKIKCYVECYVAVFAKDKVAYNLIRLDDEMTYNCFTRIFLSALDIYRHAKNVNDYIKKHEKLQKESIKAEKEGGNV